MPLVFQTVREFREWRNSFPRETTVGFVPTMGALHEGHLSLVSRSLNENDKTVVSIFVNPSQFAPHEDLDAYPRTLPQDIELLATIGEIDAIFAPTVPEMYPSGIPLDVSQQKGAFVSVLGVSEQLEGKTRPNFFRGVATVVTKLFNVVDPTKAYFGQKDIQQTIVLKKMVSDLLMRVEIVVMPIVRGEDGLALSSRNKYLDEATKSRSTKIYAALNHGRELYQSGAVHHDNVVDAVVALLEKDFKVDYVSLADDVMLQEVETIDNSKGHVLSCAVYVTNDADGNVVRLIDNLVLEARSS